MIRTYPTDNDRLGRSLWTMAQLLEYFKFEGHGSWNSIASDRSDPLRPALLVSATLLAFQLIVAALGFCHGLKASRLGTVDPPLPVSCGPSRSARYCVS